MQSPKSKSSITSIGDQVTLIANNIPGTCLHTFKALISDFPSERHPAALSKSKYGSALAPVKLESIGSKPFSHLIA